MQNELALNGDVRMTVKEVAEALGCDGETVRRHVRDKWPNIFSNGKRTYLDEEQVTYVKLKLERSGRRDLRNVAELPKTALEKELIIQQAMVFQAEKITALESMIAELAPKAALATVAIRDQKEHYSITQAGKHIGLRQSEIFSILRRKGMLTSENLPTQKALDMKILQIRTNTECGGRNRQQAIMTMENIFNFKTKYC